MLENKAPTINGDGSHSRDFTFVDNAVGANIAAMTTGNLKAVNQVYNIACGEQISLLELYSVLKKLTGSTLEPVFGPDRVGDVKHSLADISKAKSMLGYEPAVSVSKGLQMTFEWYKDNPGRI